MNVDLKSADGHIRHQHTYCDYDRSRPFSYRSSSPVIPLYHLPLIFNLTLSLQHRGAHYDVFLKFESRSYWGNHLLTYLKLHDNPIFEQFVKDSQVPFKGADTVEVIIKHYNLEIFERVKQMYAKDIELFGYGEDVNLLEQIIRAGARADAISGTTSSHS
jgi:hypothetical protein